MLTTIIGTIRYLQLLYIYIVILFNTILSETNCQKKAAILTYFKYATTQMFFLISTVWWTTAI